MSEKRNRPAVKVTVTIRGRVQGVAYRYSTRERAEELGLGGWVMNRPDGSVEACLKGEETAVDTMLGWCRQGPPAARVTSVVEHGRTELDPAEVEPGAFEIRH